MADEAGERLELTSNGAAAGAIPLADMPYTQYRVSSSGGGLTSITPVPLVSDGALPARITGTVLLGDAMADGQAVALAGNLVLSNAVLGPDLLVSVGLPGAAGQQSGTISVQGSSASDGRITVGPAANAQAAGNSTALTISIGAGAQLSQEGTVAVISQTVGASGSSLRVAGSGTLSNDGQIYVGPGSAAQFGNTTTGSGTITVDGGTALLSSAANTQTVDLLKGTLSTSPTLEATIKDWNNDSNLMFSQPVFVNLVQFNQTSDAGGDLQLFGAGQQVGDLHLLGTYATADFTATQNRFGTSLSVSGHPPPSA